jgi:23S rRNA (cytidine1920-2'-O)/16S rRNA (cytidine1409-2'-O)-methyltransferase
MKERIDKLLLVRGLAQSRHQAQALVLTGSVLADEQRIDKPGTKVDATSRLRLKSETRIFVSRGGHKLEHALQHFSIEVGGKTCLDIGASTGGFTDCLLRQGAVRVHAVDVGRNQLDWKLRKDSRVRSLEGVNARYLQFGTIGETVDLITLDLSFISLCLILPVLDVFQEPATRVLCLVKPQFELGKGQVEKGGIVRDPRKHRLAVDKVSACAGDLGYRLLGTVPSPILGAEGNQEFFLYLHSASSR